VNLKKLALWDGSGRQVGCGIFSLLAEKAVLKFKLEIQEDLKFVLNAFPCD